MNMNTLFILLLHNIIFIILILMILILYHTLMYISSDAVYIFYEMSSELTVVMLLFYGESNYNSVYNKDLV